MSTQVLKHSRVVERSPIFYGWVIWGVAMLGLIATSPGQSFSVSLFNDHFIEDFNMSRTTVSGLYGLGTFIASLSLTWVGRKIDQYGSRKVGIMIVTVFAMVLMSLSVLITGPITLFMAFFAIRFLGQGSLGLVSNVSIQRWWRLRRGWVAGLSLVGFALFQRAYLPIVQSVINDLGWRGAWVVLGVAVGVTLIPLWWFFMRDTPEEFGLIPDGHITDAEAEKDALVPEDNWTLPEAMHTVIFWVFIVGRMMPSAFGTGLIFHQVSIFAGLGHSEATLASIYGTSAIIIAATTLITGAIIHRLRGGLVMATQLGLLIISLGLAMIMTEELLLYAYALAFGMMMGMGGTFDGTVWADMYGRQHLGAIRGFTTTAMVAGSAIGPILFGLAYDLFSPYQSILLGKSVGINLTAFNYARLSNYDAVLWFGIIIIAIPMILSLFMTAPKRHID